MQDFSGLGNVLAFSQLRSVGQRTVSISCTLPTPIGLQKGRAEGEQIGIRKVALNAKKKGMSITDISELTGLSEYEISEL
jgi:hypothetical protein